MLENWRHQRLEDEERAKRRAVERPGSAMSVESHGDRDTPLTSPLSTRDRDSENESGVEVTVGEPKDHPMPDARPISPMNTAAGGIAPTKSLAKNKSPDLRVELPPVPALQNTGFISSPASSTPVSAGPRIVQSPFSVTSFSSGFPPPSINGVAASPSPVKKKLSLSDYRSRMSKAAAARPSVGTTLLKPVSGADEPKSATSTDGGAPASSPLPEKPTETTAADGTTAEAMTNSV